MAENAEKKPTVKAEHKEEAKLASNAGARAEAGEKVLAEQLAQQDTARAVDVIPEDEAPSRAAHAGEGGGAWPQELLLQNFVHPVAPYTPTPEAQYTSHES